MLTSPHQDLLTRLAPSQGRGIGVFAIRDIPAGTRLFTGDSGPTVCVPQSEVERIADPEIRRFYLDFCPLVDGAFVAPANLNQITMSWYMNHADVPNVAADRDMAFVAARSIAKGEELTVDYRRFSDHAAGHVPTWAEKEPRPIF